MRLDKLTIGSAKKSLTHQFKNLKDVTIDFDEGHWVTVVIGWNGTGKSNVLEALAIIFRDLISKNKKPQFAYKLLYRMGIDESSRYICIDADPDRDKYVYRFYTTSYGEKHHSLLNNKQLDFDQIVKELPEVKWSSFVADDSQYLPRFVFGYYSGESDRLEQIFRPFKKKHDEKLRRGDIPGLKRLFYALPEHSNYVLMSFLIDQNESIRKFLYNQLGLDPEQGIESILFVLRQPPWKSKDGDERFWNAKGVVRDFLDRLYDISLAPMRVNRTVSTTLWNKERLEYLYLYVKDIESLWRLVGNQPPALFFEDLESTFVSELIEEVRIRVKLIKNNSSVTFRELSEGEQQLLTVLGLLRFTSGEESLFLLDEPDTHLNPRWCVDYLNYLQEFAGTDAVSRESSHIVLTTHNPLSVAELVKGQVQILHLKEIDNSRQVVACHPDMDPQGLGYAAIVTSDMFGIASTLDNSTQLLLEKQRAFAAKRELTQPEQEELDSVNEQLNRLGFRFFHPDDEFSRYLRLRNEALKAQFEVIDPKALATKAVEMNREEREALATKLINRLLAEDKAQGAG